MKRAKKRPPEGWHLRAVASMACARNRIQELLYQIRGEMQAPIWTGKEVSFRVRMGTRIAFDRDRLGNRPAVSPDRLDREVKKWRIKRAIGV